MGEEAYSRHDHFIQEHIAITYAYGRLVECCEERHEYLVEYPEAICMCITTISCIQTSVPRITKMHDIAILPNA